MVEGEMRYLSIGLDKGSIIVEVVWQHPISGKVHSVSTYRARRTECGVRIPTAAQVIDKHIAVSVS